MHARINIAARAARWSAAHRKLAIFGWLAFVVVSVFIGGAVGQRQLTSAEATSGEAGRAEVALERADVRPNTEVVLIQSRGETVKDAAFAAAIADTTRALARVESVRALSSPAHGGGLVSPDRRSALIQFEIAGDADQAEERVGASLAAIAAAQKRHPDARIAQFGDASASQAIEDVFAADLERAERTSLPITLLVLLLAFGALVAAFVPLLVALSAVVATLGLLALPSQVVPMDPNVSAVVVLIGLAVGVDYSLFYLRREREERRSGRSPEASLAAAAATSGHAVLISGMTVIVAMAGMLLSGDPTFTSFGVATMTVVAVAMFASLTVLPAVLAALGDRVEKGRVPLVGRLRRRIGGGRSAWAAVVGATMRRPLLSLVLSAGVLILLALPALKLHTVVTGPDDFPHDLEVVKTYDRLGAAFPSEKTAAEVVVEADDVRGGPVAAAIGRLRREAAADEYVNGPAAVRASDNGTVASIELPTVGSGSDAEATAALERIRERLVPEAFGDVAGVEVSVTGMAAQSADFNALLSERLPLVFAFVLGLAFLLLLLTFRSIVVPIKAIALNLLSVGAAYGILVLVFQEGVGESLLGFHSNDGVSSWLPLFLFVILFGLSMDYHVLILSRVREGVDRGMTSDEAVRWGIANTAGTVTSAAVVMVAVFSVFATLSMLDMKEMGIGLTAAVLIDATIVRAVLLPATMKLLGERNWYLPRFLSWLPRVRRADPEAEPARA